MEGNVGYLKKTEKKSVVQHVIDCLTDAILNGELKPGDRIPTEMQLAEQMGVARNSVREAIKMLVFQGVLEIRRPEGTYVCEQFTNAMINPMIYGIIMEQNQSYDQLMELREMIEVGVIRLTMEKATDEEIDRLLAPLEDFRKALLADDPDIEAAFKADNRFHEEIMVIGHNKLVEKINDIARTLTYKIRHDTVERIIRSGQGEGFFAQHEKIYKILKTRQKENLNEEIRETYFLDY